MKKILIVLTLVLCLLLAGCIQIDISVPGLKKSETEDTQEEDVEILDYPNEIGTDEEKLLTPLLPDEVFITTAAENGLEGSVYQIYGTVEKITADYNGNMNTIHLNTHKGDVVISNIILGMASDSSFGELGKVNQNTLDRLCPMPSIGEFCRIFAEYQGFSDQYEAPYFIYGSTDYLSEALLSAIGLE